MPKLKKRLITARQKKARRINIAIARASKKRNAKKTRFGNKVADNPKKITVLVENKTIRRKHKSKRRK
jgi:hypothetical protein